MPRGPSNNWHPSADLFIAEITSGGAPVTDAGGSYTPYAWKEKEVNTTSRGYQDKPDGRTGTTTTNPAFELNGTSVSIGDLVLMRVRGQVNVSGVSDRVFDILSCGCSCCGGTSPPPSGCGQAPSPCPPCKLITFRQETSSATYQVKLALTSGSPGASCNWRGVEVVYGDPNTFFYPNGSNLTLGVVTGVGWNVTYNGANQCNACDQSGLVGCSVYTNDPFTTRPRLIVVSIEDVACGVTGTGGVIGGGAGGGTGGGGTIGGGFICNGQWVCDGTGNQATGGCWCNPDSGVSGGTGLKTFGGTFGRALGSPLGAASGDCHCGGSCGSGGSGGNPVATALPAALALSARRFGSMFGRTLGSATSPVDPSQLGLPALTDDVVLVGAADGSVTTLTLADGQVVGHTGGALAAVSKTTLTGRLVAALGTVTIVDTDDIVAINNGTAGGLTVNLPASPTAWHPITIADDSGTAAAKNLTLTPAAGNIANAGTYVMNVNNQSVIVWHTGTQWNVKA